MIRRSVTVSSIVVLMGGAACDNASPVPAPSPSPSPSPSPAPSPSPSPTPAPTYASFPLSADREFTTIHAQMRGVPPEAATTSDNPDILKYQFPARDNPGTYYARFIPPQLTTQREIPFIFSADTNIPTNMLTVTRTGFSGGGSSAEIEFLNNTVAGHVAADPAYALRYTSFAAIHYNVPGSGRGVYYGALGYPTLGHDIPASGSAAYPIIAFGTGTLASTTDVRLDGTGQVRVDYAARTVSIALQIHYRPGGGAEAPFLNVTGTGSHDVRTNAITGTLTGGSGQTGSFKAQFMGPQGAEIAIVYAVNNSLLGSNSRAVGAVLGRKGS